MNRLRASSLHRYLDQKFLNRKYGSYKIYTGIEKFELFPVLPSTIRSESGGEPVLLSTSTKKENEKHAISYIYISKTCAKYRMVEVEDLL